MNTAKNIDLLIVKVGTNVLTKTQSKHEGLDTESFKLIGAQLRHLSDTGTGVILVSSAAITAGVLGEQQRREDISDIVEEQRYAARGWDIVVQQWKAAIGSHKVSSTLLTKREIHQEHMRDKALDVIGCCLAHGDVFVVNENDTLSDDEIKFGDNDMLAAALAAECAQSGKFGSVKLMLLTNKNGLNKVAEQDETLIREVIDIDAVATYAGDAHNGHSRGGMKSKINAARVAQAAGVEMYIANGRETNVIRRALAREVGTRFRI